LLSEKLSKNELLNKDNSVSITKSYIAFISRRGGAFVIGVDYFELVEEAIRVARELKEKDSDKVIVWSVKANE